MQLDIEIEAPWPATVEWEQLALDAAEAAAQVDTTLGNERLCASILFTSDAEIRSLNSEWRGKDKPTNVLSFPMLERSQLLDLPLEGPPELLGDIALALETCTREAQEKGVAVEQHAVHLIVHGLLHLAGHDHETGEAEAEAMEALETKALAIMGIADPYAPDL
ncbi:rRNA maturation RNase YbeY [Novosphingobium sp. M1R2S20]|uniref:Endoribonuclease YbeY n=1 Tax=Novosphingobium rhizovicinum TaxID=3228928 RepID=A0ABV3R8L4_9SPHN